MRNSKFQIPDSQFHPVSNGQLTRFIKLAVIASVSSLIIGLVSASFAVTFDSDIVPAAGSSIRLGVQPNDISSINNTLFFSGQNVGIGTSTPSERLVIDGGGLKFTNPPARPACDGAARGIIWASQPGGSSADTFSLCARQATGLFSWQTLGNSAPWLDPAWAYREKITVQGSQVSSTQSNFPVYVNLANMQTGFFTNVRADGGDIRVTKADAVTEEPREVVTINTSAQTGELHFKADSISNATNTVFYVYYGNPSAAEPLPGAADGKYNVWDSNYLAVWHLPNGSTLNASDSTVYANNGGIVSTNATSGQMDGAGAFTMGLSYVSTSLQIPPVFTWSAWFKSDCPSCGDGTIAAVSPANSQNWMIMQVDSANGVADFWSTDGMSPQTLGVTGLSATTNWYDLTFVREGNSVTNGYKAYLNGTYTNQPFNTGAWSSSNTIKIGVDEGTGYYFSGAIDEVRISKIARSSQWIKTEYNNQSSPSTFYAVGAQETH